MLAWIRDKFGGVLVVGIIGFIAFVFVFSDLIRPKATRGIHEGAVAGKVNGDAIYGTRPRSSDAGGSVVATGDGREARITVGADGTTFAIVQGAPTDEVRLPVAVGEGAEVRMLGNDRVLPHAVRDGLLAVTLPDHFPAAPATVFAISG